jgi:hypothetical protein
MPNFGVNAFNFQPYYQTADYWLCSYSVPSDGMPIKYTMQIAVKLLGLADVLFAWEVFTP